MELSANLLPHHKVHEEQYVKYSSLIAQTAHPPASVTDEWNPNQFPNYTINGGKYSRNINLSETIQKTRDLWAPHPLIIRSSMNQDICDQFVLANIKDEMSDSFPKLSTDEMMYCHSHSSAADDQSLYNLPIYKKHYPQSSTDDLGGNLWHNNKFSVDANNMTYLQLSPRDLYTNNNGHDHDHQSPCLGSSTAEASRFTDFNHMAMFPSSTNIISTSDFCSTIMFPTSLDLNLKSLDLFTSTYNNLLDHHHHTPAAAKLSIPIGQHHSDSQSTSSKVSAFVRGSVTSSKRPAVAVSLSETMESHTDAKKQRSMSRSPCPTLKVRKEKLGDRVAALQKLVAPFGKKDTSTVLTEAIGYIQFLHVQVQTLSVPFMKSSPSKLYRAVQVGSERVEGKEELKPDLRSKGLCLVPLSYASYFVNSCTSGI